MKLEFAAAIAVFGALLSPTALAHAHLHHAVPADHSVAATAPKAVALEFNEPVQLTSLTIRKGDGPAVKLGPLPEAAAKSFSVALAIHDAGSYVVQWRALSDDGHVMTDKLQFSVSPAAK